MSLYNDVRPRLFKNLVGNEETIKAIKKSFMSKKPHDAIILSGPFGTGKTTIARIIAKTLKVTEGTDYNEFNASSVNGVENIRRVEEESKIPPLFSQYKIYVFDECQSMSKQALEALLKTIEDTPSFCIWILCTTEIGKIPKGIISRCVKFTLKNLNYNEINKVLVSASKFCGYELTSSISKKIFSISDGSARTALTALESIINVPAENAELMLTEYSEASPETRELFQKLLSNSPWREVSKTLKSLKDEPETIRRQCLGYMSSVLLNQSGPNKFSDKCALIIEAFENNWYDGGRASLIKSCYGLSRSSR